MSGGISSGDRRHWQRVNDELDLVVIRKVTPLNSGARNWFYAIHCAIRAKLEAALDDATEKDEGLAMLRSRLGRLTIADLARIYAPIFLAFMGGLTKLWSVDNWKTSMGAAELLYSLPMPRVERWIRYVLANETHEWFEVRLYSALSGSIAAAASGADAAEAEKVLDSDLARDLQSLGLDDFVFKSRWLLFLAEVASLSDAMTKQAAWVRQLELKIERMKGMPVPSLSPQAAPQAGSSGCAGVAALVLVTLLVLWSYLSRRRTSLRRRLPALGPIAVPTQNTLAKFLSASCWWDWLWAVWRRWRNGPWSSTWVGRPDRPPFFWASARRRSWPRSSARSWAPSRS